MDAEERLARLEGELLGAQAAICALILVHPDPRLARAAVAREIEEIISLGLSRAVEEAFLDGIARARDRMLPAGSLPGDVPQ